MPGLALVAGGPASVGLQEEDCSRCRIGLVDDSLSCGSRINRLWPAKLVSLRCVGEHFAHCCKRQAKMFGNLTRRHAGQKSSPHRFALPLLQQG
jgi:hypothetical protein